MPRKPVKHKLRLTVRTYPHDPKCVYIISREQSEVEIIHNGALSLTRTGWNKLKKQLDGVDGIEIREE